MTLAIDNQPAVPGEDDPGFLEVLNFLQHLSEDQKKLYRAWEERSNASDALERAAKVEATNFDRVEAELLTLNGHARKLADTLRVAVQEAHRCVEVSASLRKRYRDLNVPDIGVPDQVIFSAGDTPRALAAVMAGGDVPLADATTGCLHRAREIRALREARMRVARDAALAEAEESYAAFQNARGKPAVSDAAAVEESAGQ